MEITFGVLIFCIVAFFVAGFIDSIAGGAGFVMAPSLLLIGMPPHMALGTGKLATSIGSVVALWTFWRSNLILKKIVPVGVLSAMAGASFGAFCALQIDGATMGKVIVIMLPLGILFTVLTGGFKLTEGEIGMVQSSGTAKAFNIAANFAAFLTFASGAAVCYEIAIPCAIASMLGNRVGAYYAIKIGGKFVRNILYIVLVILMVSLIYKFFIAG